MMGIVQQKNAADKPARRSGLRLILSVERSGGYRREGLTVESVLEK